MLGFYFLFLVLICLIAYGGYENTMRLFAYIDLQIRFAWVRLRMYFMMRKLKRQLDKQNLEYQKLIKEYTNE
jgi:hypothetical protein